MRWTFEMTQKRICPFCLSGIQEEVQECPFCGASLQNRNPSGTLALGTQLHQRYTVGSYLLVDGEGVVYKAVDNDTSTFVVIKEYMPVTLCASRSSNGTLVPKEGSEVLFKTTRMDFAELYRALQKMGKKRGLIEVKNVFEQNESVYAVFENTDGMSLADYLERRGNPLSAQEATNLLMPVMQAVALLHSQGVVHYGICPQNIRICSNGEAKLGGYATMALRTAGGELKSQLYEGYTAPEQYFVERFSGRFTDVYSMAAVLYYALTGVQPVSATERQSYDTLKPARVLNPALPAYLSGVLQAAMQIEPPNRLQTIAELIDSLQDSEKGKEIAHQTEEKRIPLKVLIIAAICAGVVLIALFVALLFTSGKDSDSSSSSSESSSAVSSQNSVAIPDFVGKKYSDVYQNSEYVSKYLFFVKEEYSDTQPEGVIIAQDPKGGTVSDEKKPTITLTVSQGPKEPEKPQNITIPNVVGATQSEAEDTLKQAGFLSVRINYVENNGEYAAGCVVRVTPGQGESVSPEQIIILDVAKVQITPSPTPTPNPTPQPTAEPTPTPSPSPSPTPDSQPSNENGSQAG